MWVAKLLIRHDCTIGNKCRKFKCVAYSIPLGNWSDGSHEYTSERHTIEGDEKNVRTFIEELKNDKRIMNLEVSKNTVFFIGVRQVERMPSSFWNPKMFFVKPVFVDKMGWEQWEIASWDRTALSGFMESIEREKGLVMKLLEIKKTKLSYVHFPQVMPKLSPKQKRAFELAVECGYYGFPRKADLKELAKMMGVSVSTFQEHLRRAEGKLFPSFK